MSSISPRIVLPAARPACAHPARRHRQPVRAAPIAVARMPLDTVPYVDLFTATPAAGTSSNVILAFFQRKCARYTAAEYRRGDDGMLVVVHKCTRAHGGREDRIEGLGARRGIRTDTNVWSANPRCLGARHLVVRCSAATTWSSDSTWITSGRWSRFVAQMPDPRPHAVAAAGAAGGIRAPGWPQHAATIPCVFGADCAERFLVVRRRCRASVTSRPRGDRSASADRSGPARPQTRLLPRTSPDWMWIMKLTHEPTSTLPSRRALVGPSAGRPLLPAPSSPPPCSPRPPTLRSRSSNNSKSVQQPPPAAPGRSPAAAVQPAR